ncbi:4Fe-4S dicluster domain-containing protein [Megalodesulfovibrio paquesii]
MPKALFIDTSKCTACRGCQVACKQWKNHPVEPTRNLGSHQNPADLSAVTYKLVRMTEAETPGGGPRWLFMPDQCRHCVTPPCMFTADMEETGAITQDEATGAVVFDPEKASALKDWKDVRESCPYDIPRKDEKSGKFGKCDMCFDRISNGLKPACVLSCPTGTMNFGEREEMLALAKKRLEEVKKRRPEATLGDPDDVNVIFLYEYDPKTYHAKAVADADTVRPGLSRRGLFAKVGTPLGRLFG